ncbi:class I SAM-dependent methyltransferase [Nakamurella sp.]|uniref:class I SAM-dependent methyltransferase n=1 Tax=Nakamurella sp. TaxID=1869182 RepID=UPI003783412C
MPDWDGAGYERISGLQRRLAREALDGLEFRSDERVLDVGCGDGYITRIIASRLPAGSVVGVDASPRMIEVARSRPDPPGAETQFLVADARDLPFRGEFDTVVSFNALHWVTDQGAALTAIARSLRRVGRVVVQQVCAGPRRSLEQTAMLVCAQPRWAAEFTGFAVPFVHLDPAGYPRLAAQAGLRVIDQQVRDVRWDFGSRAAFTDWCTVGFADWTARLPPAQVSAWVDDVVDAYQAEVGEPGLFRFLQLRVAMTGPG